MWWICRRLMQAEVQCRLSFAKVGDFQKASRDEVSLMPESPAASARDGEISHAMRKDVVVIFGASIGSSSRLR
jgi:hypothetical protein